MRRKSAVRLIAEPIVLAVALALLVRGIVHLYTIPSDSMLPTLRPGDHIVVVPYVHDGKPQRGDVVVFRRGDSVLVKRVVATPGDLIATRLGRVTIGGHTVVEPYVSQRDSTTAIDPQIVPADCYFVMGDNRVVSLDSRSWGVLPRREIVGRARMVLWSSRDASSEPAARASARTSAAPPALTPSTLRLFHLIE
jgi:signal peptidase I